MWNILRSTGSSVLRPIIHSALVRQPAALSSLFHSLCRSPPQTFPARLLAPQSVMNTQIAGIKVRGIVRRRCKDCSVIVIDERSFVICKTHADHKHASKVKKHFNRWTLTHATQSKLRPY